MYNKRGRREYYIKRKIVIIILIIVGLYKNIALFFSFETIPKNAIEVTCIVEIIGLKEEKEYIDKYTLKILTCSNFSKSEGKKFVGHIEKGKAYKAGDIIKITGTMQRAENARNFYGFDYQNNLKQNKIYGTIQVEKSQYLRTEEDIQYALASVQNNLKEKIDCLYKDSYQNVINKILFGMNVEIDETIKENFRDAGISHILAISGLHISYVVLLIRFILNNCVVDIKLKNTLISCCLIMFLILTGLSPSCIRACVMNMLGLISKNVYRKNNIYISIVFSFVLLIFSNIFVIYNIGMWLSFLGTLGIVLFYPFLKQIFKFKRFKIFSKVIDVVLISFSAQILIWPVILYTFNTISLTFFISNIFISFLIGPIVLLGYLSVIVSYFIFPIAKVIAIFEEILVEILFTIADVCSKIPLSKVYVPGKNLFAIVFYYILICFIVYYFHKNKLNFYKKILFIKDKRNSIKDKILSQKGKKIMICISIFYVIFPSILFFYNLNFSGSNLEIYLVDVGQGDCIIIKTKDKNIIIDSGEGNSKDKYDYGKNVVFQHLLKLGITKIHYMIYTHMDSDHAGGLMYILENMEVENVLIGLQPEDSENLQTLMKILNNKSNTKLSVLESGDKVDIDKNCLISVLWPSKNELISENALNNNSFVFKFYYEDFSILFTGDIEEIAEKEIVQKYKENLKCDILKIAHHGSKTSTIQEFLNYARPKIALIGVGKDNKFGHPSNITVERLNQIGCRIYRTDEDGEVILKRNNKGNIKIRKVFN